MNAGAVWGAELKGTGFGLDTLARTFLIKLCGLENGDEKGLLLSCGLVTSGEEFV